MRTAVSAAANRDLKMAAVTREARTAAAVTRDLRTTAAVTRDTRTTTARNWDMLGARATRTNSRDIFSENSLHSICLHYKDVFKNTLWNF